MRVHNVPDPREHLNGLYGYLTPDFKKRAMEGHWLVGFDYEGTNQCDNGIPLECITVLDSTLETFFIKSIIHRLESSKLSNSRDSNYLLKLVMLTFDSRSYIPDYRDDRIVALHKQMCEYYGYQFKDPYEGRGNPSKL